MGAFSKLLIFSFSLVGIFALLFSLIPGAFFTASYDPTLGPTKAIANQFDMSNVTMYGNAGGDNMTYMYSSYWDNGQEWSGGLPSGQWMEVWWAGEPILGKVLEFRHIEKGFFGWPVLIDRLTMSSASKENLGQYIFSPHLVDNYDSSINGTVLYGQCGHTTVSAIMGYNQTAYPHIGEAWNNGELSYVLSYELDWNATGISAWTIMGQLLTFQNPDLGITGTGGSILNYLIAIPLWLCIGLLILFIALAIIPFISGLND